MNDLNDLNLVANNEQMEASMSNSSSSSSSISSMDSTPPDIDMIVELAAALDLNLNLFKENNTVNDKIYFNKEYLIQHLKTYLENESNRSVETDDNEIKLNELKTMLVLDSNETENESCLKSFKNDENLPRNLLVTSLREEIFKNNDIKFQFEKLFDNLKCKFCYLPTFKRCYIQFDNPIAAILARIQLHDQMFLNEPLKIFLIKPIKLKNSRNLLEAPHSNKLFLISPPCSPPVGWEQEFEDPPVVSLDLLAAISQMNPNEPCEIIKSHDNMPSIVIHPCPDLMEPMEYNLKRKFMPTRRPANDCS